MNPRKNTSVNSSEFVLSVNALVIYYILQHVLILLCVNKNYCLRLSKINYFRFCREAWSYFYVCTNFLRGSVYLQLRISVFKFKTIVEMMEIARWTFLPSRPKRKHLTSQRVHRCKLCVSFLVFCLNTKFCVSDTPWLGCWFGMQSGQSCRGITYFCILIC